MGSEDSLRARAIDTSFFLRACDHLFALPGKCALRAAGLTLPKTVQTRRSVENATGEGLSDRRHFSERLSEEANISLGARSAFASAKSVGAARVHFTGGSADPWLPLEWNRGDDAASLVSSVVIAVRSNGERTHRLASRRRRRFKKSKRREGPRCREFVLSAQGGSHCTDFYAAQPSDSEELRRAKRRTEEEIRRFLEGPQKPPSEKRHVSASNSLKENDDQTGLVEFR